MIKFLIPLFALALLLGCTPADTTDTYGTTSSAAMSTPSSSIPTETSMSKSHTFDGTLLTGKHVVTLKTSEGDITVELDADIAPKTVTNFVTLAKTGYYNGLTFHRVIPGFMIQGGDPTGNGTGGESIYGEIFADEINRAKPPYLTGYVKGVVAMANRGPNTNGSQFFIMEADRPLSPDYTIFGRVTAGQDVVSKIAAVERDYNDMPVEPVTFTPEVK